MTLAFVSDHTARTLTRRVDSNLGASALIPNGGFEVWGQVTSWPTNMLTASATEYPVVPDWVVRHESALDTLQVQRDTSIYDALEGGTASIRIVKTGANGLASLRYNLPPEQVNEWRGRTVSIRAKVRQTSGSAPNVRLTVNDGVASSSSPLNTTVPTNTFFELSVTRVINVGTTAIWVGIEICNPGGTASVADTINVDNVTAAYGVLAPDYAPPILVQPSQIVPSLLQTLQQGIASPIINGGFEIWQRGLSVASPLNSAYIADRFRYELGGTTTARHTVQQAPGPPVSALMPFSNGGLDMQVTAADASLTSGEYCALSQTIEGYAFLPFWQKQITLGFWVSAAVAGVHAVAFRNSGSDRCYVAEYTINVPNTWEYKTITVPASPSGGSWNTTNGIGLSIWWVLANGTATLSTSTPNTWVTTNSISTPAADATNEVATVGNHFKLWGVVLGLGAAVAPYWPRLYPQELALCQRYTYMAPVGSAYYLGQFYTAGNTIHAAFPHPVLMRATPSFDGSSLIGGSASTAGTTGMAVERQSAPGGFLANAGNIGNFSAWSMGPQQSVLQIAASGAWTSAVIAEPLYVSFGTAIKPLFAAEL